MFHLKDEQSPRLQLCTFSVLILLLHCCTAQLKDCDKEGDKTSWQLKIGQSQAIDQPQPMVVMVGDDVILPCHLEPAVDAVDLTVEWARPDPQFVHLRRVGVDLLLEENPLYKGRTSLSINKLKCGDVSLKLSKVKLSDAGAYRCLIPTSGTESMVELAVGSFSSPEIEISKVSSGVLLECKSKAWYPKPEVFWLDGEGKLLSDGAPEKVIQDGDLYTVSSSVTVEERHSNSFTCRVHQKNINQTREAHILVPDDLFMVQSSSAVRITICLAVCVVYLAAGFFVLWKWRRNTTKTKTTTSGSSSRERQRLMEGEGDRQQLMTESEKMKHLEKTKAKLDEESQKNEGELKHVEEVMTTLREQKKDLKNQREKLISLQQEDKTQIEENKKKLKEEPKTNKERKMEKREHTKKVLAWRQKEHDELSKNTEELLERTENLIIQMTERKGKLERDKERINKSLKETEREREEAQKRLQLEERKREEERKRLQLEERKREEEINNPPSNDPV